MDLIKSLLQASGTVDAVSGLDGTFIALEDTLSPGPDGSLGCAISGDYFYGASLSERVQIVNISDPENPVMEAPGPTIGPYDTYNQSGFYEFIISNDGNTLYTRTQNSTNNFNGHITAYDISSPPTMTYLGHLTDSKFLREGSYQSMAINATDDTLFIVGKDSGDYGYITSIDIRNPAIMVNIGNLYTSSNLDYFAIAIDGNILTAVSETNKFITIYSADPLSQVVKQQTLSLGTETYQCHAFADNVVYASASNGSAIAISVPDATSTPTILGQAVLTYGEHRYKPTFIDGFLFTHDVNRSIAIDFTDPTAPVLSDDFYLGSGTIDTGGSAIKEDHMYLCNYTGDKLFTVSLGTTGLPSGPTDPHVFRAGGPALTSAQNVNTDGEIMNLMPQGSGTATSSHAASVLSPDADGTLQVYPANAPVYEGARVDLIGAAGTDVTESYNTVSNGGADLSDVFLVGFPAYESRIINSNDFGAANWTIRDYTESTYGQPDPRGLNEARLFNDGNASFLVERGFYASGIPAVDSPYETFSCYFKYVDLTQLALRIQHIDPGNWSVVVVDLANAQITQKDAAFSHASVELFDSGWMRLSGSYTRRDRDLVMVSFLSASGEIAYAGTYAEVYVYGAAITTTSQPVPYVDVAGSVIATSELTNSYPAGNIDTSNAVIDFNLNYDLGDQVLLTIGGIDALVVSGGDLVLSDGSNTATRVGLAQGNRAIQLSFSATNMILTVDSAGQSSAYTPFSSSEIVFKGSIYNFRINAQ